MRFERNCVILRSRCTDIWNMTMQYMYWFPCKLKTFDKFCTYMNWFKSWPFREQFIGCNLCSDQMQFVENVHGRIPIYQELFMKLLTSMWYFADPMLYQWRNNIVIHYQISPFSFNTTGINSLVLLTNEFKKNSFIRFSGSKNKIDCIFFF